MQKLRQFEFLTLAIKISFLFDFCTDVLLNATEIQNIIEMFVVRVYFGLF